ncbi:Uncharacterised protein [Mycobacterium tuberculosis]|nr:Uncharacterised protein [Mycobacterium tuberculosis]
MGMSFSSSFSSRMPISASPRVPATPERPAVPPVTMKRMSRVLSSSSRGLNSW